MLKMSFYDGTLNRVAAVNTILKADKPCKYTYGFKYKHPSIYEIPITTDEAIDIILTELLLDIKERDEYFDINAYSSNDMW